MAKPKKSKPAPASKPTCVRDSWEFNELLAAADSVTREDIGDAAYWESDYMQPQVVRLARAVLLVKSFVKRAEPCPAPKAK